MRRRGHVAERGKGKWLIKFSVDNKQRYAWCHGTRRDAEDKLAQLLVAASTGALVDPSQVTVGAYVRETLGVARDLSARTLERYYEIAERQIIPHLGAIKLQRLRPEHIERWHATLLDTGLSPRTCIHSHRLLHKCLSRAVTNGVLVRNVAIHRPPKAEEREIEILSADQIAEVLAKLKGHAMFPIVSLALSTGMRRGELLGLQWSDLDLDRGTLRVERSVEETKAGLRLKPPKTKRGRRNLTLGEGAVALLRAHKVKQLELRLVIGLGKIEPTTLVFSTIEGELLRPRNITKAWSRMMPDRSFHSLRHTHVSLLIAAGVDILTISRRLGHSKAAVTLDTYGHLIEGADAAAAKAIEGVLK
jgi:integrase